MAKLTKLEPVLIERTCEHCGNGLLKLNKQCDDGIHFFKKTKYWYEYKCEKCGEIIKSDKALVLREIIYVNPDEPHQRYKILNNNGVFIDA